MERQLLLLQIIDLEEQEEIAKSDALTRAIENAANEAVPTGMHDIHIHVNLPSESAAEVYNNRLAEVPPQKTKQRAKRIEKRIDDYLVTCLFYSKSSKAIITIPCGDRQFPLSPFLDDNTLTSEFNDFVGHIRDFIVTRLSDSKGIMYHPYTLVVGALFKQTFLGTLQ